MNEVDKFLFDYFKNISTNKNSEKDVKAINLLKSKSYSNINVQDEMGNTFAHHCVKSFRWDLFEKVMKLNANMDILNNNCLKAIQCVEKQEDLEEFYLEILNIRLDNSFNSKTRGYAVNFKQYIFDNELSKNQSFYERSFQTEKDIIKFLSDSGLYTDKNFLELLSLSMEIEQKIVYQTKYFNSPDNNSYFLSKLCSNNAFRDKYGNEGFNLLLKQPLANNEDLFNAFLIIYNNNKRSDYNLMVMMVQAIIEQKIDTTVSHVLSYSLDDLFNNSTPLKELYENIKNIYTLNNSLESNLKIKEDTKVKIKL